MTNLEKYKDEIMKIIKTSRSGIAGIKGGIPTPCNMVSCSECDIGNRENSTCIHNFIKWLYEDDGEKTDGCDGCIYEDEGIDKYPCSRCRNNFTNKFRRKPKKTRQDEFLEHYPDAALDSEGALKIAPCWIERAYSTSFCKKAGCDTCQRDYWLQEVEE